MPEFSGTCVQKLKGQTAVAVPDVDDHVIGVTVVGGPHKSADALWDGAICTTWGTVDTVGGKGKQSGYFRNDHQGGDTTYGTFEATLADGATTGTGEWRFVGGTGKFAGITGGGKAISKQTSLMDVELEWSGSYNLG